MEIIIHAASNDILTLQRDWHFSFNHIFDTQLAARILGWKQTGLAAILKELLMFPAINECNGPIGESVL